MPVTIPETVQAALEASKEETQGRLIIDFMPDGRVNVYGPIGNKFLCYGMLECAKDAIRDANHRNRPGSIVVPELSVVSGLKQ